MYVCITFLLMYLFVQLTSLRMILRDKPIGDCELCANLRNTYIGGLSVGCLDIFIKGNVKFVPDKKLFDANMSF